MSLWHRLRAWFRLKTSLGLYYHPEYAPECLSRTCRVPGLPVDRVELAVGRLASEGILGAGCLRVPRLASFDDLGRFHSREYLESTTDHETLGHIFAMDPKEIEVDPLVQAQRRAVGGTIAAARAAARGGLRVAFNLGGGFHHAEPDRGGGFCVFNDVAVAVAHLRGLGYQAPILIVDLDYHQGNGNVVGFAADPSVLVYSLDGSVWVHEDPASSESYLLPPRTDDRTYLEQLKTTLPRALERFRPGLVFYLAGNDVLAGDALGGFALTPEGVLARDVFVVRSVRAAGARLVVTLAGGYRKDAWNATANLLRFLLTGDAEGRPVWESDLRTHFGRVARSLDLQRLRRDNQVSFALTEAELFQDLFEHLPEARVLGFYSASGVEYALERYGILERLRQRGFSDLVVSIDPSDPDRHFARIHGSRGSQQAMLLMELVVRRRALTPGGEGVAPFELLSVEWLLLQDPSASFSLERPRVPGQRFPGLGMAAEVQELLVQACRRLGLDGLVQRPSHYHHAAVAGREYRFWDPVAEGRVDALRQVLAPFSLAEASELLAAGAVKLGDDSVVTWEPADLVLAVSPALAARWESPAYVRVREVARQDLLDAGLHVASFHPERRAV